MHTFSGNIDGKLFAEGSPASVRAPFGDPGQSVDQAAACPVAATAFEELAEASLSGGGLGVCVRHGWLAFMSVEVEFDLVFAGDR